VGVEGFSGTSVNTAGSTVDLCILVKTLTMLLSAHFKLFSSCFQAVFKLFSSTKEPFSAHATAS